MKIAIFVVLTVVAGAFRALSQTHEATPQLTGDLRWDLLSSRNLNDHTPELTLLPPAEEKSALKAALFSAVVPGAGEFYTERYWRAGSFLATEVILWIVYATRNGKGDAKTDQFQQYADDHWSVVQYARWMETNAAILNPSAPPCSGIVTNPDPSAVPWERVDWNVLNQCEANIGAKASTGFSHRLPRRPDQQYYELIGKYLQYNAGWDDWGASGPAISEYLVNPSPRFREYTNMRGEANDYYNIATTASFILVANHILSAFDAAWSAKQYNAGLKVRAHLQRLVRHPDLVEFVPTATVSVSF